MPKPVTERRLVDVLVSYFGENNPTRREVPHYEKRIDVLTVQSIADETWAIEAKVAAWSRALSQAVVNLAAAQRSYIAIYSAYAHRVDRALLEKHGIGLIAVGRRWGDVEVLLDARLSLYTNRIMAKQIKEQVAKGHRR